ncbi:MAG: Ig domain-containing protein [Candidatus Sulfotelmatobacter sp.]
MRNTGHLREAQSYRANNNLVPYRTLLLFLLCLAGLTACGSPSQGASAPTSGSTGQAAPAGQLRISFSAPPATVEVAYNTVPSVSGGVAPYLFRIVEGSLPPGLVLNPSTGSITGTPSVAGTYNFTLYASTLQGKESRVTPVPIPAEYGSSPARIVVSANASGIRLYISPSSMIIPSQGRQQFTAQMSGTANTGVTWSASVGTISSTGAFVAPKVTSNTPVTITAVSMANPIVHAAASLTVTPQVALAISGSTLPEGSINTPYSASLSATGGVPPYQWSLASGSLPSGIQLQASTGAISGLTALAGSYPFTAKVTDSSGQSVSLAFNLTISSSQQVLNIDNVYCPSPSGVPTWDGVDGPATLPLYCLQTASANTPATGSVVNVTTAAQFKSALAAATCGEKITLKAGNSFSGHFTIPNLACPSTNWLWIQSSAVASLPAEGARYSTTYNGSGGVRQTVNGPQFGPCYAGVTSQHGRPPLNCPGTPGTYTAQLISPDSSPVLTFQANTTNVRFIGLEITRTPGTGVNSSLVALGNQGTGISGIYWDRIWAHGDENQDETGRFLSVSGISNFAMVDSYCNNFYFISVIGTGTDSKCIGGGANTISSTPETGFKIVNNFIEASGENIIMGGAASNTVPGDFEIRGNLFFKPLQWNPSDPSYNGGISGHPFIVKNLTEFKNGQRILYEGNQLINSWGGFSQIGHALLLSPANQNYVSGSDGLCPVCLDQNITMRYDTANTVGSGMELVIEADLGALPAGGGHYSIHDWVIDNINSPLLYGVSNAATAEITTNRAASPIQTNQYITVSHMTFVYPPTTAFKVVSALGLSSPTGASAINNIVWVNNVMQTWLEGTSNSFGGTGNCANRQSEGAGMINACWISNTFAGNVFINNGPIVWPAGNITSISSYSSLFTNYSNGNGGNYVIAPESPAKGSATDGLDPGANIAAIQSVLAGNPAP